jgi:hypothetical protein
LAVQGSGAEAERHLRRRVNILTKGDLASVLATFAPVSSSPRTSFHPHHTQNTAKSITKATMTEASYNDITHTDASSYEGIHADSNYTPYLVWRVIVVVVVVVIITVLIKVEWFTRFVDLK